jgi:small nuclear ribonucleoprotein (snRNP)-like protein
MQPIHPITAETCKSLCGKPVLLYLNDGSQIFGVLNRFEKNTLILNDDAPPKLSSTTSKKKNKSSAKTRTVKTNNESSVPSSSEPVLERLNFFGLPLFGGTAPSSGAIDIPLDRVAVMFSE